MKPARSNRAGTTRPLEGGALVFVSHALEGLSLDAGGFQSELDAAGVAVGRLDAVSGLVPGTDIFLSMFARKEAVLSAQIEGAQASLDDLLNREAGLDPVRSDVVDAVNYVRALEGALGMLAESPAGITQRILDITHRELLDDTRGDGLHAGGYRKRQNWIGRPGQTPLDADPLADAVYVPPEPGAVPGLMRDLLAFVNAGEGPPALVRAGVAHAQFETIHPYLDGNGRLGRLLVVLMLAQRRVLRRPLLYLSVFLRANRAEYYERLMRVRLEGDWEGWLRFFLSGVASAATEGYESAIRLSRLLGADTQRVERELSSMRYARAAFDLLARHPYVDARFLRERLGCAPATAQSTLAGLVRVGVLKEVTGRGRDRVYAYARYLDILRAGADR